MSYMGYSQRRYSQIGDLPTPGPRRSGWWLVAALGLSVVSGFISAFNPEPPYDGSKIVGGVFAWPEGCPARSYRTGDHLPHACFDRFQKISPEWARVHHLKIRHSSKASWRSYYRVGDDAVEDFCIAWEKDCRAGNVYRSVFVTDRQISDMTSYAWHTLQPGEEL